MPSFLSLLLCVEQNVQPNVAAGAIYPTVLRTNDNFRLPQLSWVALLSIAHRYEFTNMRERAIREIYDRKPGKYPMLSGRTPTQTQM